MNCPAPDWRLQLEGLSGQIVCHHPENDRRTVVLVLHLPVLVRLSVEATDTSDDLPGFFKGTSGRLCVRRRRRSKR